MALANAEFVKPLEPDKKPPGTEMFDRRHPLALRRRRPVTLVQGAVTCFDYLAANPFMQLWEADLEFGRQIRNENCGSKLSPAHPVVGLMNLLER